MNFKKYHVSRNLFDEDNATAYGCYITSNGQWATGAGNKTVRISCDSNTQYTLSTASTYSAFRIMETNSDNIPSEGSPVSGTLVYYGSGNAYTFTTSNTAKYIIFQANSASLSQWLSELMLNTGSTALPYEPYSSEVWHDIPHYIHNTSTDTITTLPTVIYPTSTTATVGLKGQTTQSSIPSPTSPVMPEGCGDLETSGEKVGQYKIPISSANTTTNVYLGEVETTRKVKKWVLTGKETSWNKGNYPPTGGYQFFVQKPSDIADNPDWLTTHFKKGNSLNGSVFASYFSLFPETSILPENATINDFKAWLTAQYDAGTPVTVWYVLATPTTGIVNEPLRKIGTYADTVSGITIPTIAGANTLSVDTTLQPSEVTVNYHGWHPVSAVHERENGAWT